MTAYELVQPDREEELQYTYQAYYYYCSDPYIAYDDKRAETLAANGTGESPWVVLKNYNTETKTWESAYSGYDLALLKQGFKQKWEKAMMDCYDLYSKDPKAMQERFNAVVDEYFDAFWALEDEEQIRFAKDYCGIEEDDWVWPDDEEKLQMKKALEAELMSELKPALNNVLDTIINDMEKSLLQQTLETVDYLNTEITFVLVDPNAEKEGFENTSVAGDIIRIEPVFDAHQNDWVCHPEKYMGDNTIFACTLYNYLVEGCPKYIRFYKTEEDLKKGEDGAYKTMELKVQMPVTTIVLDDKVSQSCVTYTGTIPFSTWDNSNASYPDQTITITQYSDDTVRITFDYYCVGTEKWAPSTDITEILSAHVDIKDTTFGLSSYTGDVTLHRSKTGTYQGHDVNVEEDYQVTLRMSWYDDKLDFEWGDFVYKDLELVKVES